MQQEDLETDVPDAVIEPDLPEEPELDVDADLDDQAYAPSVTCSYPQVVRRIDSPTRLGLAR